MGGGQVGGSGGGKVCFKGWDEQHICWVVLTAVTSNSTPPPPHSGHSRVRRTALLQQPSGSAVTNNSPLPPHSGHSRVRRAALLQQPSGSVAHCGGQREEGDRGSLGLCRRGKACFTAAILECLVIPYALPHRCTAAGGRAQGRGQGVLQVPDHHRPAAGPGCGRGGRPRGVGGMCGQGGGGNSRSRGKIGSAGVRMGDRLYW